MPNYFHLVPKIREESKYFDVSQAAMCQRLIDKKYGEFTAEHQTGDLDGTTVYFDLRLNISCKAPQVEGWAVSIKLHGQRIDGVDHHAVYDAEGGNRAHGWHRHGWDTGAQSDNIVRAPIEGFEDVRDIETFVRRVCKTLKVKTNAKDHDLFSLPEDS